MSEYMEGYEAAKEEYRPRLIEAEDEIERLRAEIERLRSLLERARPWVRAELGEYEMFLARPGMVPDAYDFGKKKITEIDALLTEIEKELRESER